MTAPTDLIQAASAAMIRAYAPYSNFSVGASLRGANGGIYSGCNVENAAYPQGCCAEASAISAMILAGETEIVEACVMGRSANDPDGEAQSLCTPCGGCRQRLREFANDQLKIHVCAPSGWRKTFTLGELLPASFGPDNLK